MKEKISNYLNIQEILKLQNTCNMKFKLMYKIQKFYYLKILNIWIDIKNTYLIMYNLP